MALSQFANLRAGGLRAIDLAEGDTLIGVAITDGEQEIMLFSNEGKAIRFKEQSIRAMSRVAKGVRGMRVNLLATIDEEELLDEDGDEISDDFAVSRVVSLVVAPKQGEILCACENGFGKRTPIDDYPTKGRGGKGVIAIKTSERNGQLVKAIAVTGEEDVILISDKGTLVRTPVAQIANAGRNAQGVKLIRIADEEVLVGMACVEHDDDEIEESEVLADVVQ